MTERTRKFLIFSLQGSLYALDLAQVAEVGDPPQMYPIPLAPPYYSGALNFHGDIVAVMNLGVFLGLAGPNKPGKIIVLHQEIASLAFIVDTVVRIVSEMEVSFSTPSDGGFASASLELSDGDAIQIDLDALVHEAETAIQKSR
jgi:purine-binding chemotaxis protein CheW